MQMLKTQRWIEWRFPTPSDRPKVLYEYWVSGRGQFPFDMLRFDSCWPVGGEDAAKLVVEPFGPEERRLKLRSIKMNSYHEPTIGRWDSFVWSVGNEKLD